MFFNLKILSKNRKSLQKFLKVCISFNKKNKINFFMKYFSQKQQTNIFTILKSPHVNKKAQEQFEFRLFSKQLVIFSFQLFKLLIVLKKIQTKLFPDIGIKIKFFFNNNKLKKQIKVPLNPLNFKLDMLPNRKNSLKVKKYLKLLDIYGEISFTVV